MHRGCNFPSIRAHILLSSLLRGHQHFTPVFTYHFLWQMNMMLLMDSIMPIWYLALFPTCLSQGSPTRSKIVYLGVKAGGWDTGWRLILIQWKNSVFRDEMYIHPLIRSHENWGNVIYRGHAFYVYYRRKLLLFPWWS